MLGHRLAGRRRQVGPVEPGLAVDVRSDVAHADERVGRALGHRHVAPAARTRGPGTRSRSSSRGSGSPPRSSRPPARPRARRARACRAIASSCPGSQSTTIGVVSQPWISLSHASSSSRAGSEGWAPSLAAANAPGDDAQRSASSRGRPSSSPTVEPRGERIAGAGRSRPGRSRRRGAGDLLAVLEQQRRRSRRR